jgi:N-acyl homoserine lactone hydrolase
MRTVLSPWSPRRFLHWVRLLCLSLLGTTAIAGAEVPISQVRLYVLDCGHAEFENMGMLSDTGEYDGKPGTFVDPCFLVQHPKGTLLWDTGLGDQIADNKNGVINNGHRIAVPVKLLDQLRLLGLTPADIRYIAFSHLHFDHTGNANAFASSTWIINQEELKWALGNPTPFAVAPASFSAYKTAKTRMIDNDYDVFGDGSVRILKAPGHTPGSQVLAIKLKKSGTVILAGDLYHTRASRKHRRIPSINTGRADTLASIDRIEKIVTNTRARLVIQHDPADFTSLPKLPAYLD